jgi:hypothetical protein
VPERNLAEQSDADSWTNANALTQRYDTYKVDAVTNELAGKDHSGSTQAGVPSLFGMTFQSVSTAEVLTESGGKSGGYGPDGPSGGPNTHPDHCRYRDLPATRALPGPP